MLRKVLARKGQEERAEIKLVVQLPDKAFETGLPGLLALEEFQPGLFALVKHQDVLTKSRLP